MNIINLPHRQTFTTKNDEAAKAIEKVAHFIPSIDDAEYGFTTSDYENLSEEAKEVFDLFKGWNDLLVTDKDVIVMKLTVCDSIGLIDPSMLGLSKGWYEFN